MDNQLITQKDLFSLEQFDHTQRVAKVFASSDLVPKEYKGNIQNTIIAMEMANRVGANPLAVMQNLHIIHGKPSWSATFVIASINGCGKFHSLRYEKTGKIGTSERGCIAWTLEKSIDVPKDVRTLEEARAAKLPVLESPEVTMAMAKAEGWLDKPGSKWKTMPELMLMYRAATFFGRLYAPDLLMGMKTEEETYDISHVEVQEPDPIPVARQLQVDKETDRMRQLIDGAQTLDDLKSLQADVPEGLLELFNSRLVEMSPENKEVE